MTRPHGMFVPVINCIMIFALSLDLFVARYVFVGLSTFLHLFAKRDKRQHEKRRRCDPLAARVMTFCRACRVMEKARLMVEQACRRAPHMGNFCLDATHHELLVKLVCLEFLLRSYDLLTIRRSFSASENRYTDFDKIRTKIQSRLTCRKVAHLLASLHACPIHRDSFLNHLVYSLHAFILHRLRSVVSHKSVCFVHCHLGLLSHSLACMDICDQNLRLLSLFRFFPLP